MNTDRRKENSDVFVNQADTSISNTSSFYMNTHIDISGVVRLSNMQNLVHIIIISVFKSMTLSTSSVLFTSFQLH